jgi:fucose permease
VLWLFSFFLLIYVGAENGAGGWVTTYLTQTTSLAAATAALVASVFWLALTLGGWRARY